MFENDRPIKPDKNYLEAAQEKYQQQLKAPKSDYLKKQTASLLPCQQHKKQDLPKPQQRSKKTKAEVYEQIKGKNRSKFGEWKKQEPIRPDQKVKKIHPKKMTVPYWAKEVRIDTEQYKKQGASPLKKTYKEDDPQKIEYGKMVEYLKKCYKNFEQQKQQFDKQREYLKFKKFIQNEEGILEVQSKVDHIRTKPKLIKVNPEKQIMKDQSTKKTVERQNNKENNGSVKPKSLKYSLDKLDECHPFTLKEIYTYIEWNHLYYDGNPFYQEAFSILENQRHSAVAKNLEGGRRISKFPLGWFQVWAPGQNRVAYNEEKGYKVVWYNNGDVKQEFGDRVYYYFCKRTKVSEIKVKGKQEIWFFPELNQLQKKGKDGRQVIFCDGRHQWVGASE